MEPAKLLIFWMNAAWLICPAAALFLGYAVIRALLKRAPKSLKRKRNLAALLALGGSAALLSSFYIPQWPMLPKGFTFADSTVSIWSGEGRPLQAEITEAQAAELDALFSSVRCRHTVAYDGSFTAGDSRQCFQISLYDAKGLPRHLNFTITPDHEIRVLHRAGIGSVSALAHGPGHTLYDKLSNMLPVS